VANLQTIDGSLSFSSEILKDSGSDPLSAKLSLAKRFLKAKRDVPLGDACEPCKENNSHRSQREMINQAALICVKTACFCQVLPSSSP